MSEIEDAATQNAPDSPVHETKPGWEEKCLRQIREVCEEVGLVQTAVDRWSDPNNPKVFVESGYVYGEVKVAIQWSPSHEQDVYRIRNKKQRRKTAIAIQTRIRVQR